MGRRCRFVPPDVVRIAISDEDWIDVKKELNAGETRRIFTDLVKDFRAGEMAELDPRQVGITKILNYIVGWSLTDENDRPVPFSMSALENLDIDTYTEINQAIEAHDKAVDENRTARKNARTGETASLPTSPSVAG